MARAMAVGERGVAGRHVEQRAVRLHMLKSDAFGRCDAGHGGDLIQDEIFGFFRRHVHVAAAEADEIRKARMGADGDAVGLGERESCPRRTEGSPA